MKKAVIFIADGSEEIETLTPVDYLRRAGIDVTLVAVGESRNVVCSRKVGVVADMTLDEYLKSGENPDAVVVPGGMPGTKNIAESKPAVDFVKKMDGEGKLVCAICAAPALVLSKTGCLAGKKWTCYPSMEEAVPDFRENHVSGKAFVHSGNLITGRGPGAAEEFSMEIVKTLAGPDVAAKVKADSVQR